MVRNIANVAIPRENFDSTDKSNVIKSSLPPPYSQVIQSTQPAKTEAPTITTQSEVQIDSRLSKNEAAYPEVGDFPTQGQSSPPNSQIPRIFTSPQKLFQPTATHDTYDVNYMNQMHSPLRSSHGDMEPDMFIQDTIQRPIIKEFQDFNENSDCETIKKAFTSKGSYDVVICDLLTNRSAAQRLIINNKFTLKYGSIIKLIKKHMSGHRRTFSQALLMDQTQMSAFYLKRAIKNRNFFCINEMAVSNSNKQIDEIIVRYALEYNKNLIRDVKAITNGNYNIILGELFQGKRKKPHNFDLAYISDLIENMLTSCKGLGLRKFEIHNKILCLECFEVICTIDVEMFKEHKISLKQHIKKHFFSNVKNLFLEILQFSQSSTQYYAAKLMYAAEKKDITTIGRILLSRAEVDLGNILMIFSSVYSKDLCTCIHARFPKVDQLLMKAFKAITTPSPD